MGRPPGSKNKPKEGEATASPTHNSDLTEAEKQTLLVRGLADLEAMIDDKNEIVGEIRSQRKRLISYGFEAFEIDYALRLRKNDDSDEVSRRRREAVIARFLSHPIGTQPDMFDEPDRTPAVDRAFALGKIAGAEGKTASSPHSTGSEQEQAWLKGWHAAQADLASGFKKLEATETVDAGQTEMEAA